MAIWEGGDWEKQDLGYFLYTGGVVRTLERVVILLTPWVGLSVL